MRRFVLFSFTLAIFAFCQSFSQDKPENLPKLLGANNIGKEFWFTIPPVFEEESSGFQNYIKIYVSSTERTLVTVDVPGKGYHSVQTTVPNDVIMFKIEPSQGQAYQKPGLDPEIAEKIYQGAGIHVYADFPVIVYVVARYKWTSDGFLAIPVSSLGSKYFVAGYPVDPMFQAIWSYKLPNITGIVAAYDETKVNFTLGGNPSTKTAGGLLPGQSESVTLNKGDVWMISTKGDSSDLSGSVITASNPVAVVTGNQCANIPNGNQWCDYTCEMDIPSYTWSYDYHVPKIVNRKYSSVIRLFAKEDETSLYRDGNQIGYLPTAGGIQGKGFIEMRVVGTDVAPRSAVISGDKPIGITLYNTGIQEDGDPPQSGASDPFVMALTPFSQYQDEITFCTPGINGDAGFEENYLALVYKTNEDGSMPDDVEFAQVVNGKFQWSKIKDKFPGTDEIFSYDINGRKYALKTLTLPEIGVYKIRAASKFVAYSYGFGPYDSYGYPTSAAFVDQEKNDTIKPVVEIKDQPGLWKDEINIGTVTGTVTDYPSDEANRSNLSMIVLDPAQSYNYKLSYDNFIAGQSATTNWTLTVDDIHQKAEAVVMFTDRCGNMQTAKFAFDGITSVSDLNTENGLSISPEPAITEINIKYNVINSLSAAINIFNASGSAVYSGSISTSENVQKIDISSLPSGIYMLQISDGSKIINRKFTVIH